MIRGFLATLLLSLYAASAQAGEATRIGDLVIETPWARASIGVNRPGAVYLTIRNEGCKADTLLAISSPISGMSQTHATVVDAQGVARMERVGPLEIPPTSEVILAPGGKHVMLMKLREPLVKEATFPLRLRFERSGEAEVTVLVYGPGARGPKD